MYTVSVIIPTYNRSSLVRACVESLLGAGVPGLEVVVADDGSTDDTEAVTRAFGEPVRYVRQANAGPAAARNHGFAASRGRYVSFLDSDDTWRAGIASRLVAQMDRHQHLALTFADTLMGNSDDGYVSFVGEYGEAWFPALPSRELEPGLRQLDRWPFLEKLARRNVMFLGSLLVRREAFEASGGFDVTLRGAADWEFFMRMTARSPLAFSDGPALALYEKHDAGMSTDADHMETDFALALERLLATCELPAAVRRQVESRLTHQWFSAAWQAYERSDFPTARQRLHHLRRLGHAGLRELGYLALLSLPGPLVAAARRTKRALVRTGQAR